MLSQGNSNEVGADLGIDTESYTVTAKPILIFEVQVLMKVVVMHRHNHGADTPLEERLVLGRIEEKKLAVGALTPQ